MKIEIEIDESKIMELAQASSIEDLPRAIFYEAKQQAVQQIAREMQQEIVSTGYSSKKELSRESRDLVTREIHDMIREVIAREFSEVRLQKIIEHVAERTLTEWMEKKIYARLEQVKADIAITSYNELDSERES